jgi:hypothetical protein
LESVKKSVNAPQLPIERIDTYMTPLVNPYLTPLGDDNTGQRRTENAGPYYFELGEIDRQELYLLYI